MRSIIRNRILAEHGNKCAICGSTSNLEIDHIIPVSKGGREDEVNMQVLCKSCNLSKGNRVDYRQFFIIDESSEYMKVDTRFGDLLLTAQEVVNITRLMLKRHRQYWESKK